jgi:hypothetical protein
MNKPTPALNERGEFVVAKLRSGAERAIYTLNEKGYIRGEGYCWHENGRFQHSTETDRDIINLPELRATVERAAKWRDERDALAGTMLIRSMPRVGTPLQSSRIGTPDAEIDLTEINKRLSGDEPRKPTFSEALLREASHIPDGPLTATQFHEAVHRARRASGE